MPGSCPDRYVATKKSLAFAAIGLEKIARYEAHLTNSDF